MSTSTTTDDGSFGPDDFSDDESATITSEDSQQGSLSSHDTIPMVGHQATNNDSGDIGNNDRYHLSDGGDTPNQQGTLNRDTQFQNFDNNERGTGSIFSGETNAYLSLTVTNSSAASSAKSSFSSVQKSGGNKHAQDENEEEDELFDDDSQHTTKRFFIVKSTYPKYSKWDSTDPELAECERRSKTVHEIVHPMEGFESECQAEYEARRVRNDCEAFRGACAPLADDGEFSEYEDNYHFNSFDDPPWDSEILEETEREQEVIINFMSLNDFKQKLEEKASDEEYMKSMDKIFRCEEMQEVYECKLRVRDSGCSAYYSYPTAQPWDVKAEMEVKESGNCQKDATRKMRPEIGSVESFMFRGRQHGMFGWLLETCHQSDRNNDIGGFKCDENEIQAFALLRHLQACKSLRELFIQLNTMDKHLRDQNLEEYSHVVNKTFIHKLVYVAPHLDQLRVLSFGPSITLYPGALLAIAESLPLLERLDISFALSMEFAPQGSDEVTKYYPYEDPLLACVNELDRLNRLDLGFEMVDFRYIDSKGQTKSVKKNRILCLISEVALQEIRQSLSDLGGIVTETATTKTPPWEEEESDKTLRALHEMIMDPQLDDDIRQIAIEKYQDWQEDFALETSDTSNDRHQSNLELLLEASDRCNAIEEVRSPAKDIFVERKSLGTSEQVNKPVHVEDIHTIDDVVGPSVSKKRVSNVPVDDTVNSKRFCV